MSVCHPLGSPRGLAEVVPAKSRPRAIVHLVLAAAIATTLGATVGAGSVAAAPARPAATIIDGQASVAGLAPAIRMTPPAAVPSTVAPATPAPVKNVSSCRTDMGGSVATLTIPSISYVCPLYSGTQATIDTGAATWVSQPASIATLARYAGGPGAIWLAGHRTSHGGAFAGIPALADGAIVTIADATATASYRVVGRAYVRVAGGLALDSTGTPSNAATLAALLRPDLGAALEPRLVIQTCDGVNYRWMIYADLIRS